MSATRAVVDTGRRSRRRRARVVAVLLSLVCLTVSCGEDEPSVPDWARTPGPDAVTSPPATSSSPSPTAAAAGSTHVALEGSFQTEDGYRFGLDIDLQVLPPVKTVINDRPGFATIEREFAPASQWRLTNLLPDRISYYTSNTGDVDFGVWGFYKRSRPICKVLEKYRYELNFTGAPGKTCSVLIAHFTREQGQLRAVQPGQTVSGGFSTNGGTVPKWRFNGLPEASVDAVMKDLADGPDATTVLLEGALQVTGWRTPFQSAFDDDTACLLEPTGTGGNALIMFLVVGSTKGAGLTQYVDCRG